MLLECNFSKLYSLIESFQLSVGVSISMFDGDYSPLVSRSVGSTYCRLVQSKKQWRLKCMNENHILLEKCKKSGKPEFSVCSAGLIELALPLIYDGTTIGYLLVGHVRPETAHISREILLTYGGAAEEEYSRLQPLSSERVRAICNMSSMLADYILSKGLICPKKDKTLEQVRQYVDKHLSSRISVSDICDAVHISRGALYELIRSHLGCTVNEFIVRRRLEMAKRLLTNGDDSVEEIARCVGISSAAYLARLFKQKTGTTPLKFRKNQQ